MNKFLYKKLFFKYITAKGKPRIMKEIHLKLSIIYMDGIFKPYHLKQLAIYAYKNESAKDTCSCFCAGFPTMDAAIGKLFSLLYSNIFWKVIPMFTTLKFSL